MRFKVRLNSLLQKFFVTLFVLFSSQASPTPAVLKNRNVMIQNGDYFLVQTAGSPLQAVALEPDSDFCFRAVPVGGTHILYYGSKGQGSRRLVIQNFGTEAQICTIKETLNGADDIDEFRIYKPAGEDLYVIRRGQYFVGVGDDFGMMVGTAAEFASAPESFLFDIKLADEVLAAIGIQAQIELDMLKASFDDQVQRTRQETKQALIAQMFLEIENATDEEVEQQKKQLEKLEALDAELEAEAARAEAEANLLKKRVYEIEALRQAEAAKINGAVANLEASMEGMSPEELAVAKEQVAIMKSSKAEMVKRLEEDAKVIAANKKRNIELSMQVAKLKEQKAKAQREAAETLKKSLSEAETAQEDRVDALKAAFATKKTEVLKQMEILQAELDKVEAENTAMAEAIIELEANQAEEQAAKNQRIAKLQGIVYAPDTFTKGELVGLLSRDDMSEDAKAELSAKIESMSKAGVLKLTQNEINRVYADKKRLANEVAQQMETLKGQAEEIEQNAKKVATLSSQVENLDQAKQAAQQEVRELIDDNKEEIESLEADLETFIERMNAEITTVKGSVSDASTDTEKENAKAQERAFQTSIAEKKNEVQAAIQLLVNRVNASFADLSALIEKDSDNLKAQRDTLTEETESLVDQLTQEGSADTEIEEIQADYRARTAELDDRINRNVDMSGRVVEEKQAFNQEHIMRTKFWEDEAKALVDDQINALQAQMSGQSEAVRAETEQQVAQLKEQSRLEMEKAESAQKEAINVMQKEFEANKKVQEAQIANLEGQIDTAVRDGQAAVARLEQRLDAVQEDTQAKTDAKRHAIQAEIDRVKLESINLVSKLEGEHKKTLNQLQTKLDERKQMQQDYIDELQNRKEWAEQAIQKEIELLNNLYAEAQGAEKEKLRSQMDSTQSQFDATLAKIETESSKSINDIKDQIAAQEQKAADEQARLEAQMAEAQRNHEAEMAKERSRIEGLIGKEREDAKKALENLRAEHSKLQEQLSSSFDQEVAKAEQAKADAQAANELKVGLLEQQLMDLTQRKRSLKLDDSEEILIQLPGNAKFLTAAASGAISFVEDDRFKKMFRLKVAKEDREKMSIRLPDDSALLTLEKDSSGAVTGVSMQPGTTGDDGTVSADQDLQAFYIEGEPNAAIIKDSGQNGVLQPNADGSGLAFQKGGEGTLIVKRLSTGSGSIESMLSGLYSDPSIESTIRGIAMADVFFVSNRIFNQPDRMNDFANALSEFVDGRDKAGLLSESAANKLGALMEKMDRFLITAENADMDTRGKTELDAAVLASLTKAKEFLDPIAFADGDIVILRKDDKYLTTQSHKDISGKTMVKFGDGQPFDPSLALKIVSGGQEKTYALETLDGSSRLTRSGANISFSPPENIPGETADSPAKIAKSQLFLVEGTRAAITLKTKNEGFVSIFTRQGSDSVFMSYSSKDELDTQPDDAPNPLTAGSFQLDVFKPGTLDHDFITNGISKYSDNSESRSAIGAISEAVRGHLFDQNLKNAEKLEALTKFEKYLESYINEDSLLDWARSVNSLVDAARQQLPNADPEIFAKMLESIEAFAVQDGSFIIIQNIYSADESRQGVNSYIAPDEEGEKLISDSVEEFGKQLLFRVVARGPNTAALISSTGGYAEATDNDIIINPARAYDENDNPVEPTPNQLFNFIGSGSTVTIRLAQTPAGSEFGYVVIDAKNDFTHKNNENLDDPFYRSSNLRSKFKIETLLPDSVKYNLLSGELDNMPALFFDSIFEISEDNITAEQKTELATAIVNDFVSLATDRIEGAAEGEISIKIKDNMAVLQTIKADEEAGIYPMGQAIEYIRRYALYDANFRKNGVKFDEHTQAKFEMLEQLFPLIAEEETTEKTLAVNITPVVDPSGKGLSIGEHLNTLWQDKADSMAASRILHAFLTTAARVVYGSTFDDNSDIFGMDEFGQVDHNGDTFMLKRLEETFDGPDGDIFFKVTMMNASNEPLTKTIEVSLPALLDEDGTELEPAQTINEEIEFGIVMAFDPAKDPTFYIRPGQGLRLNPELVQEQMTELSKTLNTFAASNNPIIRNQPSAQQLLKTMISSLSGLAIPKAPDKYTISEKIDEMLRKCMKLHLQEQFKEADTILKMFGRSPRRIKRKERMAASTTLWKEDDPLYLQFFNRDQRGVWTLIRKQNTKKMRAKGRGRSKRGRRRKRKNR